MEKKAKRYQFYFPHPITQDLTRQQFDHFRNPPPLYSYYQSSDSSIPSSKIIRANYKWPLLGKKNSLVLQPFHPGFTAPKTGLALRCQFCATLMNPFLSTLNTYEYECNVCKKVQKYDIAESYSFIKNSIVDCTQRTQLAFQKNQNSDAKIYRQIAANRSQHILFIIQLNQQSYNFGIHQAISNFIETLQNQNVGFLLFNQTFLYINQLSEKKSLKIFVDPQQLLQLPVPIEKIMGRAKSDEVKWATQQLIPQLMHQSFFTKKSCLYSVQKMLSKFKSLQNFRVKFIINSLDKKDSQQNKENNNSQQFGSLPFQFFVINQNMTYRQIMQMSFADQIQRVYDKNSFNKDDLYYDLFHSHQRPLFNNVQLIVRTSKSIIPSFNRLFFKRLTSECPIVIQYEMDKKNIKLSKEYQVIQFEFKFGNERRVITYPINQFVQYNPQRPQKFCAIINDQVYFYLIIRNILSLKDAKKLQTQLIKEIRQLLPRMKQNHYIHTNLRQLFLYSYAILNLPLMKVQLDRFNYEKNRFFNQNLETFVKKIYLRTYQVFPQLQNIKSVGSKLDTHQIYLIQNGITLFLVIGEDCPVQKLKQSFGYWDISKIIQQRELPQLETNLQLRNSIEFIRSRNQIYFLPLKIISMDSNQFQQEIGRFLYVTEDHRRFLEMLFEKKNTPKKQVRY